MLNTIPVVNLNGTKVDDLITQQLNAIEALNFAYEKVAEAAPHGRDFIGKDTNYTLAAALHRNRTKAIYDVLQDHRIILHELLEQKAEKEKQKR